MQACSAVWAGARHCTKSSAWSYVHHIPCTISHREACCGGVHPAACQHCIWYKSRQFITPTDITLSIECACNNSQLCPLEPQQPNQHMHATYCASTAAAKAVPLVQYRLHPKFPLRSGPIHYHRPRKACCGLQPAAGRPGAIQNGGRRREYCK